MSASLLRRGLELLGEPAAGSGAGAGRDPPGRSSRKRPRGRPTRKNQATAKGKVTKSALEEFRKRRQRQDHLQENLRLMRAKHVAAEPRVTAKILLQNQGRKARDRPAAKPPKEKPQGTVFTEEDFRKFQEEYFGSSSTK